VDPPHETIQKSKSVHAVQIDGDSDPDSRYFM